MRMRLHAHSLKLGIWCSGTLASLDIQGWGPEPMEVDVTTFDAFQLPSPTEEEPTSGWLTADKLPALSAASHKIHPLPEDLNRMSLSAASKSLQLPGSKPQMMPQRPRVPKAKIGSALQTILAEQARAQDLRSTSKAPMQAQSKIAPVGAAAPSAPSFGKRNNSLAGAAKPVVQSRAATTKQGIGASSKKPPLPAKRPLPATETIDKKPAAPKRPKPVRQEPFAVSAMPLSTDEPEDVARQRSACLPPSLGPESDAMQASAPGNSPGPAATDGRLAVSEVASNPTGGQQLGSAAPRKRTQITDIDAVAVESKVASCKTAGTLASLTVPELKTWLKAHKLPVGGKKADLVARLESAP